MSLPLRRPAASPAAAHPAAPFDRLEPRLLLSTTPSGLDADTAAPLAQVVRARRVKRAATPRVEIADAAAREAADGESSTMTFTLRRRGTAAALARFTRLNYATAETGNADTATSNTDFTAASGRLVFRPGEKVKRLTVNVIGDDAEEGAEELYVNLSNIRAGTLTDNQATGTIVDDDVPTLSIDDVTDDEGDAGVNTYTFTVTLDAVAAEEVTVDYTTVAGTASAGSDFTAIAGTLTFDPGDLTKTIDVDINGDTDAEATERFTLVLSNATYASITDATGVATITDDDTPLLSIADADVVEGDSGRTFAVFDVTLDAPSSATVTVKYRTVAGTAVAGDDFIAKVGTLTFAPADTSESILIAIPGDTLVESNKQFSVVLSNPVNANIADGTATGTIYENEVIPTVSVADVTVTEGQPATVTFTLSGASSEPVVVSYATADDDAEAGSDYTVKSGAVTFRPGQTTRTVVIATTSDSLDESDEAFTVGILSATNAAVADGEAQVTITDDDDGPTISVADVTVAEDGETATFTVTLSAASNLAVTVDYATADDTAEDENGDDDYTADSGTLTFTAGQTSKTVEIDINDDDVFETAETFLLQLSNASNATIADDEATATITNDDALPRFAVDDVTEDEGNAGDTALTFTITLTGDIGTSIVVNYTTIAGTATLGTDFTPATGSVTFDPGDATKTFTINALGDATAESDETFLVLISLDEAGTGVITDGLGTGTITNDD